MKQAYIIIDLGTGNSRVALTTLEGQMIDFITFENQYHKDSARFRARYFIPEDWMSKIGSAVTEISRRNTDYEYVAITATSAREGIVLIGESGKCVIGLPNEDGRGRVSDGLKEKEDRIYQLSGHWLDPLFSALKLTGYRDMYPEQFDKIIKFTSISEWIGYELTRKIAITPSHACETQLFDIFTKNWSEELCGYFGVERQLLPEIKETGQILGCITDEMAEKYELPKGLRFILAGADTQAGAYGTFSGKGEVTIVAGTTTPIVTMKEEAFYDEKKRCWASIGFHGTWMVETNTGTAGMNYQKFKNNFFPDMAYEEIEEEIKKRPAFRCVASFGTKKFYEQRSLPNGGFFGSAPYNMDMDRIDMAAALIADEACSIALHFKHLTEISDITPTTIAGCGGGFQSELLGKWVADLTQLPVVIREGFSQASIQGCVRICNDSLGRTGQEPEVVKRFEPTMNHQIDTYYERWEEYRNLINNELALFHGIKKDS